MVALKGEGAPRFDSGDAQEFVGWHARHNSINADQSQTQALRAELTGSHTCTAAGLVGRGATPVLSLCRQLLAAGLDADSALEVYRGTTLAVRVRRIGEAAAIEIASDGIGFRAARNPDAAPLVRKTGRAAPDAFDTVQAASEVAP
jgi:hypothetical protein